MQFYPVEENKFFAITMTRKIHIKNLLSCLTLYLLTYYNA